MNINIGTSEQKIRIGVGALLLIVAAVANLPGWLSTLALAVGVVALATGAIRFCPAWRLFGINTCGAEPSQKPE